MSTGSAWKPRPRSPLRAHRTAMAAVTAESIAAAQAEHGGFESCICGGNRARPKKERRRGPPVSCASWNSIVAVDSVSTTSRLRGMRPVARSTRPPRFTAMELPSKTSWSFPPPHCNNRSAVDRSAPARLPSRGGSPVLRDRMARRSG